MKSMMMNFKYFMAIVITVFICNSAYSFNDSTTYIGFQETSIKLNHLLISSNEHSVYVSADSAHVIAEMSHSILGKEIEIENTQLRDIKIEVSYEVKVSLHNEGPLYEINNWKQFYSPWESLLPTNLNVYKCLDASIKAKESFSKISFEELNQKNLASHAILWDEIKNELWLSKSKLFSTEINRVLIRVSGQLNGKSIKKIIVVEEAIGC